MRIIYEANDGKQFDTSSECEEYEAILAHPSVLNVDFYDINNTVYHIDRNNFFDDSVYQRAVKVIIHNRAEFDDFAWMTYECGWWEFDEIISDGSWMRFVDDVMNPTWKKVEVK